MREKLSQYMQHYNCCFCGNTIQSNVTGLLITINWDKDTKQLSQQFFCHLECFQSKIQKDIPVYLEDLV